ncbi:hypothetical protein ACFSSA_09870 [Luteolibacter algae]|uniref:Uncharacterized protein n=1 Tax=Luteolibacter algae TaxID=454151 RepID=A0ABW5D867_9BACT
MSKHPFHILTLLCTFSLFVQAQNLEPAKDDGPGPDEVQKAIEEFNRLKMEGRKKANEVTVVLDPPEPPAPRAIEVIEEDLEKPEAKKPVLVSGKPPQSDPAEEMERKTIQENPATDTLPTESAEQNQEATPTDEPGLEVRVESIRKGSGIIDPKQVALKASFPAKPLGDAPQGWLIEKDTDVPSFIREVELQPGTTISLKIQPHVLTPQQDGLNIFSVTEPGYNAAQGYGQEQTVGAILGKSIIQLDEDSKQLGNALSELHRLLASLPQAEAPIEEIVKP